MPASNARREACFIEIPADGRRDTMIEVKAAFKVAQDNNRFRVKGVAGNPAASVTSPPKRQKRTRASFTCEQRQLIIARSVGQSPLIRIGTIIMATTGSHIEEVSEADTRDIETLADSTVLFHIRELYKAEHQRLKTSVRTRSLPLHSTIRAEVVAYRDRIVAEYGEGRCSPRSGPTAMAAATPLPLPRRWHGCDRADIARCRDPPSDCTPNNRHHRL